MPTNVEHVTAVDAFHDGRDVFIEVTGLPLINTVHVQKHVGDPGDTVGLNFTLDGGERGSGDGTLSLDIQLLVPAVQTHDFLL